jgi:hypothetical protein
MFVDFGCGVDESVAQNAIWTLLKYCKGLPDRG